MNIMRRKINKYKYLFNNNYARNNPAIVPMYDYSVDDVVSLIPIVFAASIIIGMVKSLGGNVVSDELNNNIDNDNYGRIL